MPPPRPHRLRRFRLLGFVVLLAGFAVPGRAQLQERPESKPPAAAPPADASPEKSPPPAPPPRSPADVTAEAQANYEKVRLELERLQRERAAETQASLEAAKRTNAQLAERLGALEQSLERQRAHDAAYLRDYTRVSLFAAGGLGVAAVLTLGVIIALQIRASRQQTAALDSQAKVLAALPQLLPQLTAAAHAAAHPTITSAQSRFHDAVDRVKQQLDEIETLAEDAAHDAPAPGGPGAPRHDPPPPAGPAGRRLTAFPAKSAGSSVSDSRAPAADSAPPRPTSGPGTPSAVATLAPESVAAPVALAPALATAAEPEVLAAPGPAATPRESVETLLARSQQLLQDQEPAPALAYLERAANLAPGNVQIWLRRGQALEKLDRLHEALAAYDMAASIDPTLPVAHLSCAGVLNRLQRFDDAIRAYERALAAQNGTAETGETPAPPA